MTTARNAKGQKHDIGMWVSFFTLSIKDYIIKTLDTVHIFTHGEKVVMQVPIGQRERALRNVCFGDGTTTPCTCSGRSSSNSKSGK